MGTDTKTSPGAEPSVTQACTDYRSLDQRRMAADGQAAQPTLTDAERELLWHETEQIMADMLALIDRLARMPSTDTADLSAKSSVLASLMRADQPDGGPALPSVIWCR